MNRRYERWRWQTFGITWLIYACLYLTRQSFGVAKVALQYDPRVQLSRDDLGWVDASYATTYALGQFLFGPLGDRFGPRRILLVGLALSVGAAVASGFSTALAAFAVFAALQGIAQATGWSNVNKTMSSWFSLRERGRVTGWWCSHYTVGAAVALPFAGWMMDLYGSTRSPGAPGPSFIPYWPAAFWGPAAVLSVVLALTWLLLRNRPEDVGLPPIEQYHGEPVSLVSVDEVVQPIEAGSWKLIGEVISAPSIWMLAVAYFSVKFARYAFFFWGPKYVEESLGGNAYDSALTASALQVGGVVGVIGIGYVSDKWFQGRRAPAAILSLLATAAIMFIGLTPIHNEWLMRGFLFAIGVFLFGPDSMISATAAIDFGTKRGAGTATGFINGIGSCGGILGGWLPGRITEEGDWTPLFMVFLIGLIASAVILLPLWRAKPPTAEPPRSRV